MSVRLWSKLTLRIVVTLGLTFQPLAIGSLRPLSTNQAWAEIPELINYQARLTDSTGAAVEGTHTFICRMYDAATSGTKVWEESVSHTLSSADNGIFNISLGATTALSSVDFNVPLWLSLEVDSDGEMTPRQRLMSVGYAINAGKLDGLDSTKFLRTDIDTSTSGKLTITNAGTGFLIKPTTDPTANTKLIDVQNAAGTSKFSVDLEGDVAVAGDLSVTGTISGSTSTTGTTNTTWTIGSGTDTTANDISVLFGQSTGQESIIFDGDSTDDFVVSDDMRLSAQGELRLEDDTGGEYVALKAPTVVTTYTLTMPAAVASSTNQVLSSDTNGALSWATVDTSTTNEAPTGASYVTISTDSTLSAERTLAAGTGLTLTDAGANGAATVALDTASTLTHSGAWTLSGDWVNTTNPWVDNEVSDTLTASIFKGPGSSSDAVDLDTAEVSGTLGASNLTADSLDFAEFKDAMALDANTTIGLGSFNLIIDDTKSTNVFQLQNAQTSADTAQFYVTDTATAGAADLDITTSDGDINLNADVVIDTEGYTAGSGNGTTPPTGGLFVAVDPTLDDSDGVIFLGKDSDEVGGWGELRFNNSNDKFRAPDMG